MDKSLDHLYHALLIALKQEYEHYQGLIGLLTDGSSVLIDSRLPEILDFNSRQERLLLSLRMAAELRLKAIREIAAHLSLPEPLTMRTLIAYAPPGLRKNLLQEQENFSDLAVKLKQLNASNQDLIAFSLSYLKNTLNYIQMLTSPSPGYDQRGQIQAGKLQGRLISQEG